jgi:hypothetical protein
VTITSVAAKTVVRMRLTYKEARALGVVGDMAA